MSARMRRRRVSTLVAGITCAALLTAIGVVAGPVLAAGSTQPVLFSIVAHDSIPRGVTSCPKGSEVGLEDCAALKVGATDRKLDATAAQILVADQRDETGPGAVLTAATATADLSAAQRSWLAFRKADCQAWTDPNAGGTIVGLDFLDCAVRDGKTRLAELQAELKAAQPQG